jgi:hypothetical protein
MDISHIKPHVREKQLAAQMSRYCEVVKTRHSIMGDEPLPHK